MLEQHRLPIARIHVPVKRVRTLEPTKVEEIANDMLEHGQRTPIRCRLDVKDGETRYVLVEGYHRLEAARSLGEETIVGYLVQARFR